MSLTLLGLFVFAVFLLAEEFLPFFCVFLFFAFWASPSSSLGCVEESVSCIFSYSIAHSGSLAVVVVDPDTVASVTAAGALPLSHL